MFIHDVNERLQLYNHGQDKAERFWWRSAISWSVRWMICSTAGVVTLHTLHTAYRTSQEVFEVFTVSALIQK